MKCPVTINLKSKLRQVQKRIRGNLNYEDRARFDNRIFKKVIELDEIKNAKTILLYVSKANEVSTRKLIPYFLGAGKTVALPKARAGREMDFYITGDLNDLETGFFGVLEPKENKCRMLNGFQDSVCIVPALCVDAEGHRVGYGMGYYDRFLDQYEGCKIALCYSVNTVKRIPSGQQDVQVDMLVTENKVRFLHQNERDNLDGRGKEQRF